MSKQKDSATKSVLDYLNRQNRPYSAIDIFNNLHKEYGKTAVVRSLEELAQEGKIKEKTYGKQKVYVADQSQWPAVDEHELKQMDTQITEKTDMLRQKQIQIKKLEAELQSVGQSLTTEEAETQLTQLKEQIEKCTSKLSNLKENQSVVSPEERTGIMATREKYVKAWRKRKRISNDILGSILEGYPKTKKQLYEDVGIETDEDYGVKPPEL